MLCHINIHIYFSLITQDDEYISHICPVVFDHVPYVPSTLGRVFEQYSKTCLVSGVLCGLQRR